MIGTIFTCGFGYSCFYRNFRRYDRASCESSTKYDSNLIRISVLGKENVVLTNKWAGLCGALLGCFIPGSNYLIWSQIISKDHTRKHEKRKKELIDLALRNGFIVPVIPILGLLYLGGLFNLGFKIIFGSGCCVFFWLTWCIFTSTLSSFIYTANFIRNNTD